MMLRFARGCGLGLVVACLVSLAHASTLIFDLIPSDISKMGKIHDDPNNFRTTWDDDRKGSQGINRTGLADLKISGSAQFSASQLKHMLNRLQQKDVILVDLRQEHHFFLNGLSVCQYSPYFNATWGKTSDETKWEEEKVAGLLRNGQNLNVGLVTKRGENDTIQAAIQEWLTPNTVQIESKLAAQSGVGSVRFAIADDQRPSDVIVDEFLAFMKTVPSTTWLHFHCRGGRGRTTQFMVMTDILKNGTRISLNDILNRQWAIGGNDLVHLSPRALKDPFLKEKATERLKFIQHFYEYVKSGDGLGHQSWSTWVVAHPILKGEGNGFSRD
ncbi:MAG: hypothetical protein NTX76_03790 [Alphaproteobacteria bacterium]|nr:hypothetical protein [Alphaproteobacteria bacterium]